MHNFSNMTLKQLRALPSYTSGSDCNRSLEGSIDYIYNRIYEELNDFSSSYGDMTPAELCASLRELADDIEYYNIPQMREIQEENHASSNWWN